MQGLELTVDKHNLLQLLTRYKPLSVPIFQRPYSWEPEQWSQLWDDLYSHLDNDYLIGGIVLCGDDTGGELIIDGQQRLATLTILAATCRDIAFEMEDRVLSETVVKFHDDLIAHKELGERDSTPFLSLGEADREWFRERIQESPDYAKYLPPGPRIALRIPSSNRSLWKCYLFFRKQLSELLQGRPKKESLALLAKFYRLLHKHLWFVVTRVPDDTTAYTLFEVLNDRGLDLTIADLLKNVVLSEGQRHKRFDHAKKRWALIADQLDYPHISSYLRYSWMSANGRKITDNELFATLKSELTGADRDDFTELLDRWSGEADEYAEIAGISDATPGDVTLARELDLLHGYGFRTVYTLLLAIWAVTSDADTETRAKATRLIRVFMMRYSIFAGQVTNVLEGSLAALARDIRTSGKCDLRQLAKKLAKIAPRDDVTWGGFVALEPRPAVARLLLTEIEDHLAGDEKKVRSPRDVHVEHIFPQSADERWIESFRADGEESTFRDRLGNLTLLSGKKNRSISNKAYSEKVKLYQTSQLLITKELPTRWPSWTAVSVDERQHRLLEVAREIWAIEA